MAKIPDVPDDIIDDIYAPYIFAVGKVVHAWNHMQEELGRLFCAVAEIEQSTGMAIWHALKSDRTQRDILEAAMLVAASDDEWSKRFPKGKDDLTWLLNRANEIADKRNNAVHAPCIFNLDLEIIPWVHTGSPHARRLRGKDLIAEFSWYRASADIIRRFAEALQMPLFHALYFPHEHVPWPDRPEMPILQQAPRRKE